ncbi:MAG: HEPN domain-containing protein [Candidatus Omnitrophica bacterium]|nr:HEPN domain-containing protein [Candidatus Omnitrophota bacterium]
MPPDGRLKVVRQWIEKAEEDLRTAEHALTMGRRCPFGAICFHAQQCVEKYLKALLVFRGIDFPKTHNIPELLALVPSSVRPELSAEEQEQLTDYATTLRYPGDWEPITRRDAKAAVETARRIREAVRKQFPKTA